MNTDVTQKYTKFKWLYNISNITLERVKLGKSIIIFVNITCGKAKRKGNGFCLKYEATNLPIC